MQPAYETSEEQQGHSIKAVIETLEGFARDFDKAVEESAKGKRYIVKSSHTHVRETVPYLVYAAITDDHKLLEKVSNHLGGILDVGESCIDKLEEVKRKAKRINEALQPYIATLKPFSQYTHLQLAGRIKLEQMGYTLVSEELAQLRKSRERIVQVKEGVCCEFAYLWAKLENGELPGVGNPLKLLRNEMIEEANSSVSSLKKNSYVVNPVKEAGKRWCELLTPKVVEAVSKRAASKRNPIDGKMLCCWKNLAWTVTRKSFYERKERTYAGTIEILEESLEEKKREIERMENVLDILDSIPFDLKSLEGITL